MNSLEFVTSKLKELHFKFPQSIFKYEYRESRDSHLIEVLPEKFYNDIDYIAAETKLENDFESLFPLENILFISTGSINKVTDPILVLQPQDQFFYSLDNIQSLLGIEISEYAGENNYALAA